MSTTDEMNPNNETKTPTNIALWQLPTWVMPLDSCLDALRAELAEEIEAVTRRQKYIMDTHPSELFPEYKELEENNDRMKSILRKLDDYIEFRKRGSLMRPTKSEANIIVPKF